MNSLLDLIPQSAIDSIIKSPMPDKEFLSRTGEFILQRHFIDAIVHYKYNYTLDKLCGMVYAAYLLADSTDRCMYYREILDELRERKIAQSKAK